MLWEDVFCQSKRSVTGCREQEDLVLSQKKVQSAADMLWVAFIEFYWAWYAEELQITTIFASLFTSLRAWCEGVHTFVIISFWTLIIFFLSNSSSSCFSSPSCEPDVSLFPAFLLCSDVT
jgi:hypothetical protein